MVKKKIIQKVKKKISKKKTKKKPKKVKRKPLKKKKIKRKGTIKKRYEKLSHLAEEFEKEVKKEGSKILSSLFSDLYEYATRDHLTGVYNRKIMDDLLDLETKLALRERRPLCVVMLDIDDFKKYNDKFGHIQGDMALRKLTQIVQRFIRKSDFVARFGGEEFIIVLPNTTTNQAKILSDKIRKKVSSTKIRATEKGLEPGYDKITISMGIAKLTKTGTKGIHDLLIRADKALYKAKKSGKNKVVVE